MADCPSDPLPRLQRFSYGVGHVLNDLCASMWFSYLLIFFHNVLEFSNVLAGYLMLLGQVADAIVTPFIGYETDNSADCCNYGRRKTWHLVGVISVACSFPFLFMRSLCSSHSDDWAQFIYYAPLVVIFQFGWATTQISHLSLIPALTPCESTRVELNSIRYAFTVISSIMVYSLAWVLLSTQGAGHSLGPSDSGNFRTLALCVVGIGSAFCIAFHIGTRETDNCHKPLDDVPDSSVSTIPVSTSSATSEIVMTWRCWLKEYQFYQVAMIYMCTRLIVNISQIYIPMYLTYTLHLHKVYIAIVPLIVFVSGFFASISMKMLNKALGRKGTYGLGLGLVIVCSVWLYFLHDMPTLVVIGPAIIQGLGASTLLITSLSMTADLIGENTYSGAFVYGAMSFTDKLSNGIVVVLIQHFHPCNEASQVCCPACDWYYRDCLVFIPGGVAVVACILLLTLIPVQIGRLNKTRLLSPSSDNNQFDYGATQNQ